ncbi:MAG: carboxypeptidase-like regulatory domain-containing protein, partial [Chitinophagaceae bacterium]
MIKFIYGLKRSANHYGLQIRLVTLSVFLVVSQYSPAFSFSGTNEISISRIKESQPLGVIKGQVTNSKGEPLAGVTILLKGTTKGTTTGSDGRYSIDAPDDGVLIFRYLGFVTQEMAINSRANIDIELTADVNSLNGVVVTALGIKRQSRSLAYGVQQLSNNDINQVPDPSSNIMNALSGKVAGAVITPAASGPGGAVRVVLRGNRSINGNNNALIVVDGVPIDNTMTTELNGGGSANTIATQPKSISSSYSGSDGAASINPEDVQSISILAGPAAAALYGSRAANGAIIITTKSGESGNLSVDYNGGISFDLPYMLMKFQNIYGRGDQGQYISTAGGSWGAPGKTYPNNVRDFYNTGATVNNYVSVTG